MQMIGADWISSDKREDDLGGRLGGLVQEFAAKGGPEFFFVVNMQVTFETSFYQSKESFGFIIVKETLTNIKMYEIRSPVRLCTV